MQENNKIQTLIMEAAIQNSSNIFINKHLGQPKYTFADMYDNICRIGTYLSLLGIAPDVGNRVAICLGRTPEYIISFLACLLYGYCAVLVEDTYPKKRIDYILEDSEAKVLINTDFLQKVSVRVTKIIPPLLKATESTDAVITYTSGSTGNPKGVLQHQRSVAEAVRRLNKRTGISSSDIVASAAPFTFAMNVFDIIAPFTVGAGIVIASSEIRRDVKKLADFHKEHKVSVAFIPPSLLCFYKKNTDTLRLVVTASEKVCNIAPCGYQLINLYGQTEMYLVTSFDINKAHDVTPIGKPLDGVCAYILDENGNEVTEGELCISGYFFAEYINDPEKTCKTRIENPFKALDGHPYLVHTGDLVRRLEDGNIMLLNRMDWMIKINGMRVEPGEIEVSLKKMNGIQAAIVKGFEDSKHKAFLVAYYIAEPGADVNTANIKAYLNGKLPYYMIPSFFVKMDAFPVNANGKLNRLALEPPEISSFQEEYVAPENSVQEAICTAFAKVLSLNRVGITDDFFALGGDSIKVISAAEELDNLNINVRTIYKYKTPRKISESLKQFEFYGNCSDEDAQNAKWQNPAIIPYQRYYIDYQLYTPQKTGALVPFYLNIPKPKYKTAEIASALATVLKHFAIFGTVIEFGYDGELRLSYKPEYIQPVEIITATEKEAMDWCIADVKNPLPVLNALPYRVKLFDCKDKYILYLIYQHFLLDGTAQMNTLKALMDTLEGKPLWTDRYYYYLEMLENIHSLPEYQGKLEEYTRTYFNNGYEKLPHFDHNTGNRENMTRYYKMQVPYSRISKKVKEKDLSIGRLLNAAGLMALREYNHSEKVQLSWIYTGRYETWMNELVGITMASIPIAIDFSAIEGVDGLLNEIKRQDSNIIPYATLSPANAQNSPVMYDSLTMINEGGLKYPDNLFENAYEDFLFAHRTSASSAMECVFLPSPPDDSATICININTGVYTEETAKAFEELVEKNILLILGL